MRILNLILAITVILALYISDAGAAECNRECLTKMADDYLSALVSHTPDKVPLADNVRMVENANPIKPGEGLFKKSGTLVRN
jgi:hypothetical protein